MQWKVRDIVGYNYIVNEIGKGVIHMCYMSARHFVAGDTLVYYEGTKDEIRGYPIALWRIKKLK